MAVRYRWEHIVLNRDRRTARRGQPVRIVRYRQRYRIAPRLVAGETARNNICRRYTVGLVQKLVLPPSTSVALIVTVPVLSNCTVMSWQCATGGNVLS